MPGQLIYLTLTERYGAKRIAISTSGIGKSTPTHNDNIQMADESSPSVLASQLDLPRLIAVPLPAGLLQQIDSSPPLFHSQAPDEFMGRIMLARLATFYEGITPVQAKVADLNTIQERCENFRANFVATLPPTFALEPSQEWDDQQPKLSWTRQILHIAIFDSICRDLRPLICREPGQIQSFSAHEKHLLDSLKEKVAMAAIEVVCNVRKLHFLSGGSYARLPAIILPAFEAAVLLVSLLKEPSFLSANHCELDALVPSDNDLFGVQASCVTRNRCLEAFKYALKLLDTLANVSQMAMTSKETLSRLAENLPNGSI